jgi:N-methylhydantoinase B
MAYKLRGRRARDDESTGSYMKGGGERRSAKVTREIIGGKLLAIVDEMAIVLSRSSMSPVVYEVLDFACGICDADGDLVAQTNGITVFTGTFSDQVRFIRQRFGDEMAPGDTFLTNDPFNGGTHACDFAVIRPIFFDGGILGYAIAVAHLLDVGGAIEGSLPPDAVSMFQEGLRLPGVRLTRNDRLEADLVNVISSNVRLPIQALGDLNAELAAVRIGERRLVEAAAKYGAAALRANFTSILDSSEARSRAVIAALPDGEYAAEDVIDGDGASHDAIPIRVVVRVIGDRLVVDFTGSSSARDAPINCSISALRSAVKTVFKSLVGPQEPSNEGWFRPLSVIAPPGTVFSATPPSPTGWYYEGTAQASEIVWKALAPLVPERFSAGSYMSLCATYITGRTEHGLFVHIEPQHGGWGATAERDGASGLIAVTDGDTYNYSVELLEAKFPLLVHRYDYNVEGGVGAGRHRGGFGLVREYEILCDDANLFGSFGRNRERPWGVDGGSAGSCNSIEVVRGDERMRLTRPPRFALKKGDRVRIITGGGGGWGRAGERAPGAVLADRRDGLISTAGAREIYGVIVDPAERRADAAAAPQTQRVPS